jgi:hypothetical protein
MMRRTLYTTLLAVVPRVALACPVCFGQNDSPLALGINYGILAMLGFIGSLLLAFAGFFIYLMRRARLVDLAEGNVIASPLSTQEVRRHLPLTQEGTI